MKRGREVALLAFLIAGGLLHSPSASAASVDQSLIERVSHARSVSPEGRAFYLITIAESILRGDKSVPLQDQYVNMLSEPTYVFSPGRGDSEFLPVWIKRVSRQTHSETSSEIHPKQTALAITALNEALSSLSMAGNKSRALYFYYAASILYKRLGDREGAQRCEGHWDKAILDGERAHVVDEAEVKALVSILNALADKWAYVDISDRPLSDEISPKPPTKSVSDQDFKHSETLRLRAVGLADKLDEKNHTRRKVHRDLALWYMALKKTELANQEKAKLFELVGVRDDSLLYPQSAGCGFVNWWKTASASGGSSVLCGMG